MKGKFDTQVQELKYRVLKEVAKSDWEGTLEQDAIRIPEKISPGPKPTMRCCIYKERAIAAERVKLAMGGDKNNPNMVEVIEAACDQCPLGGMEVTSACRGCLAHRCQQACPRNAISFGSDHKCRIDPGLCVKCGLCAKACQYGAIIKHVRPCEQACKIHAISARPEDDISQIDEEKCTRCGACVYACPFGAIMDKSYILKAIDLAKRNERGECNVYMIFAPSLSSQFEPAKIGQVVSGIEKLGYHAALEAALGADMVAYHESSELAEKGLLFSSCCPAFKRYVKTAFPDLDCHVSSNLSPMAKLAQFIKRIEPTAKTVFCGPCIAKKMEQFREDSAPYVDCVITFEELQAMFDARGIDLMSLPEKPLDNASYFGRIFARSGGLSDAVKEGIKEHEITNFVPKTLNVSGLDNCRNALSQVKAGKNDFNFLEGMACVGGCIGGPCCLTHELRDAAQVDAYGRTAQEKTIKGAVEAIMPIENP